MEQVLRSLRRWLRANFDWCPDEVRIRNEEGTFVRPSLVLIATTSSHETLGSQIDREVYSLVITFYPQEGDDTLDEAWKMNDRLTRALRRAQESNDLCIRLCDFTDTGVTELAAHLMPDGVSARTFRDEMGVAMTVVDFRVSTLRFFDSDTAPAVEEIAVTDPVIADAELTDITWQ